MSRHIKTCHLLVSSISTQIRGPVYDGEKDEAHGEDHERDAVEGPMLGATEHDALVNAGAEPRQHALRPVSLQRVHYRRGILPTIKYLTDHQQIVTLQIYTCFVHVQ